MRFYGLITCALSKFSRKFNVFQYMNSNIYVIFTILK